VVAVTSDDSMPIVLCGDPVLRNPATTVEPSTIPSPGFQAIIDRMRVTMDAAPGVGLAAPQIGVGIALCVLQDGPDRWRHLTEEALVSRERTEVPFTVLVNPVVEPIESAGFATFYEGCLSVPGLQGVVRRPRSVRVRALDRNGEAIVASFTGWPARIVQHEVDHLNGTLYLDRVETRSISTDGNLARWAGRPLDDAAAELGFT
jgi:peptide deformylase